MTFNPVYRLDAFFYLTSTAVPIAAHRTNVFLVPDLSTVHHAEGHTEATRRHWSGQLEYVKTHADLVITYSEHTRQDVAQTLGMAPDRICAVPLAAVSSFEPVSDRDYLAIELSKAG